ncbi:acetoacetate decarboxylase family protein [Pseudoalteromonas sp. DL2-H2.2]|uniref:acetoacetate decarboxylase family protein n=1 Tax=Pseudoalteromonas sp. DL2-H2.2 TaxID=2908889 RepID=UPI001F26EC98|nr:acetoacetate decarboxylase family protein [Pseudoalteromonas sp. DL2-H2.2]MCF2910027.1 acetoacetate decarboxylase family protein [Pseudoalteromonas sp. DL2-H2.2]
MKLNTLMLSVMLVLSNTGHSADLSETYPVTSTTYLSDGTPVNMPFHVQGEATSAVVGLIDANVAQFFLWNWQWEPVRLHCEGSASKGIGALYTQKITASPAGAYNETISSFYVKRRGSEDPILPCPGDMTEPGAQLDFTAKVVAALGAANAQQQAAGKPHNYALYNQHLMLDNPIAIKAGREIWGYPKQAGDVSITITAHQHALTLANQYTGQPMLDVSYTRQIGVNLPLHSVGDNVLPDYLLPDFNKVPQLSGVLSSDSGWMMPFVGEFTIHSRASLTTFFLAESDFTPVAVLEFPDVSGVALPLYDRE